MKQYYYAVKNGREKGIFDNWEDCSKSIKNFPNQEYKKFQSKEEAYEYLEKKEYVENEKDDNNKIYAYVASQYNDDIGMYSFGNVIVMPDGNIISNSDNGNEPKYIISKDVSGRLLGSMNIIKQCADSGCTSAVIYSSSDDMEKFASGAWKPKTAIANDFKNFLLKNNNINVDFCKIDKNQDTKYYTQAQNLAKGEIIKFSKKRVDKHTDKCFIAEGIKEEELIIIIELLKENENKVIVSKEEKSYEKIYKFSMNREKCILHYYKNNNKVMVQGKQTNLLFNLIDYIVELVEVEKIPQVFNTFYNIDIDKKQVYELYQIYLPNVPQNIGSKFKNSLTQSIYNMILTGEMYEASFLLFPSLRVTEGIIKEFLLKNNISYIDRLDMFEETEKIGKFKLKDKYKKNIENMSKLEKIEKLYSFYHRQRHTLFHWGSPGVIDDTKEILDVNVAHQLIRDNLKLINEYYMES